MHLHISAAIFSRMFSAQAGKVKSMLPRLHALVLGCGLGKDDQVLQAALEICQAAASQGAHGIPWDPHGILGNLGMGGRLVYVS